MKLQLPQLRMSEAKSAGVQVPEQAVVGSLQLGVEADEAEQEAVTLFE